MVSLEKIGSCKTEADCAKLISAENEMFPIVKTGKDFAIVSKNLCDALRAFGKNDPFGMKAAAL